MSKKKIVIFFFTLFLFLFLVIYLKLFKKSTDSNQALNETEDVIYKSNIIEDVNYATKDAEGNEYIINALKGEIDFSNTKILFLTNVKAQIRLKNAEIITITSNYGKYNSDNFDTIFSKNVIIKYLDNKITSNYLDFSLNRNSMIISKNVIYSNTNNILNADVIEINIKTKDTKIFMHEQKHKINIQSKN